MKILLYNWAPDFDPEKRGGGVRIYQEHLLEQFAYIPELDVTALYGGLSYSLFRRTPFIRKLQSRDAGHKAFQLVNSETIAPAHHDFGKVVSLFDGAATVETIRSFLYKTGPFDVIHFNNLEGLPASVISLKKEFPSTKFIYSLHNYYFACPQVNLWRDEKELCVDYEAGERCLDCVSPANRRDTINAHRLADLMRFVGIAPKSALAKRLYRLYGRYRQSPLRWLAAPGVMVSKALDGGVTYLRRVDPELRNTEDRSARAMYYVERRRKLTSLLNENIDVFLAVSKRTAKIAVDYGLSANKTKLCYIGTPHAKVFEATPKLQEPHVPGELTLCYMGYPRKDKGFIFFLELLESLPKNAKRAIAIKLMVPGVKGEIAQRLSAIENDFKLLTVIDGYTHGQLPQLLKSVDLGIVPVLWEDNLPQVALEFVCNGVPILTSDLGGASEISANGEFIFKGGDINDFYRKLMRILKRETVLNEFWKTARAPTSMDVHLPELLKIYQTGEAVHAA